MNTTIKTFFVILLTTLFLTSCSNTPTPSRDPHNDADSQRSRAGQAQGEMSRDTK